REAFQAAAMHRRHRHTVTGHSDEPHQPLASRFNCRLQRAARAHRFAPLILVDNVMQLPEIDGIDLQALKRALQFGPCRFVAPLSGLGGQEELVAVTLHPDADVVFRFAVAGSHINVVDPVLQQKLQGTFFHSLVSLPESGRAEYHAAALMASSAEGLAGYQWSGPVNAAD